MSIQMTVAFTPKYIQQIVYFEYMTTDYSVIESYSIYNKQLSIYK